MKKILVIDNYDSFTYNLVHCIEKLTDDPLCVFRNDALKLEDAGEYDKILLSPGPGIPNEAGICLDLIRYYAPTKSILGVCLGHQAMNIAYGGTIAHTRPLHGKTSEIRHDGKGIFRGLENPMVGGRYHSLAIEELSPELEVSAKTADGVIMGVRHRSRPHCGLQFHPESVLTPDGKRLISNWIEDVVAYTR